MARYTEGEIEDEDQQRQANLYRGIVAAQMRSKRGQALLRELIAAMEALPSKKLVYGAVAKDGCLCGLGAIALMRRVAAGEDPDVVLAELSLVEVDVDKGDEHVADWAERELGVQRGVADEIAWTTDSDEGCYTPEERYDNVLQWARKQLRDKETAS